MIQLLFNFAKYGHFLRRFNSIVHNQSKRCILFGFLVARRACPQKCNSVEEIEDLTKCLSEMNKNQQNFSRSIQIKFNLKSMLQALDSVNILSSIIAMNSGTHSNKGLQYIDFNVQNYNNCISNFWTGAIFRLALSELIQSNPTMIKTFMSFEDFKDELGSWKQLLEDYTKGKTFSNIYKYVKDQYESGKKCYPPQEFIFNAFKTTSVNDIKVVIVGQDPYHQPGQAHGLCFSVLKPVPPPPSLKNIYKNLERDKKIDFKTPKHGDLTHWAEQGVLLLNASLTVEDSKPNSHAKCGWQDFTTQVINIINKKCDKVVFLLWGKPAQEKAKNVDTKKHHVLKTSHPSPLSFKNGFQTSTHFSQTNEYLVKTGRKAIDWSL